MRPGAPLIPACVWQLLQSPEVTLPTLARVFTPSLSFAE
jgi:hypothetical protein